MCRYSGQSLGACCSGTTCTPLDTSAYCQPTPPACLGAGASCYDAATGAALGADIYTISTYLQYLQNIYMPGSCCAGTTCTPLGCVTSGCVAAGGACWDLASQSSLGTCCSGTTCTPLGCL